MISNSEALQNVSTNLRRMLNEREWTQLQLARASGENAMQISRIVGGKQMPSAASLARIAFALSTTADYLLRPPAEISEFSS